MNKILNLDFICKKKLSFDFFNQDCVAFHAKWLFVHLCVSERIVFLICVPTGSGYSRCVALGPPAAASSWDLVLTSAFRCKTLPITHITE